MKEIVAEITRLARRSPDVNQRSGVSVRASVANYEALLANALRRAIRLGDTDVVPRISDLAVRHALARRARSSSRPSRRAATTQILERLMQGAVVAVFNRRCDISDLDGDRAGVQGRPLGRHRRGAAHRRLRARCSRTCTASPRPWRGSRTARTPAVQASAIEFVLEGLHLNKRLNKDAVSGQAARTAGSATRTRGRDRRPGDQWRRSTATASGTARRTSRRSTPTEVLEALSDDLMNFGDLQHALRNLMQRGMRNPQGDRMQGLRDLLQQLRQQRRQRLDQFDLGGVMEDIRRQLEEILDLERGTLDERLERGGRPAVARRRGPAGRRRATARTAAGRADGEGAEGGDGATASRVPRARRAAGLAASVASARCQVRARSPVSARPASRAGRPAGPAGRRRTGRRVRARPAARASRARKSSSRRCCAASRSASRTSSTSLPPDAARAR